MVDDVLICPTLRSFLTNNHLRLRPKGLCLLFQPNDVLNRDTPKKISDDGK